MSSYCEYIDCNCKYCEEGNCVFPIQGSGYPYDAPCFGYEKEDDDEMNEVKRDCIIYDDEPVVMFCNEAMKTTLVEHEPTLSDSVVVTDVVDPLDVILAPVKEFREWLYDRKE